MKLIAHFKAEKRRDVLGNEVTVCPEHFTPINEEDIEEVMLEWDADVYLLTKSGEYRLMPLKAEVIEKLKERAVKKAGKTIEIKVMNGVVVNVEGLPDGYDYIVKDMDVKADEKEKAEG